MLKAALTEPDPVLIFENQTLYNVEDKRPDSPGSVDITRATVRRLGTDVTILSYGAGLYKSLAAATNLADDGIDAEVVDLRVLRPLDDVAILKSAAKTHRVVIVDEGWRSGGISAEISARIMELAFFDLDRPVVRLCGAEVPVPYAKHLEEAALPQIETIVSTVKNLVQKHG
jgi:pyruvate/2-oxoglutarate/acetoin dehydrogenase E1 component